MANKIHAVAVPQIEFEFEDKTYTFVYNLATMNRIAKLAREEQLPTTEDVWDQEHIRSLIECTGLSHHPDEDWDYLMRECDPGALVQLSLALSQMISEQNERAFGAGDSGEVTEPTEPPAKRRRKASTG